MGNVWSKKADDKKGFGAQPFSARIKNIPALVNNRENCLTSASVLRGGKNAPSRAARSHLWRTWGNCAKMRRHKRYNNNQYNVITAWFEHSSERSCAQGIDEISSYQCTGNTGIVPIIFSTRRIESCVRSISLIHVMPSSELIYWWLPLNYWHSAFWFIEDLIPPTVESTGLTHLSPNLQKNCQGSTSQIGHL